VIQYNKRDLPNVTPTADLREALNPWGVPDFEASASLPDGPGVFDTLKTVVKMILHDLRSAQ
jgi:hypothetical protein